MRAWLCGTMCVDDSIFVEEAGQKELAVNYLLSKLPEVRGWAWKATDSFIDSLKRREDHGDG